MKKHLKTLVLVFLVSFIAKAEFVDLNTAKQIAKNHYFNVLGTIPNENIKLDIDHTELRNGNYMYYIFNVEANKGFVIIAADDNVYPILGYSLEKNFSGSKNNRPPQFKDWMENYTAQIEYAIQNDIPATEEIKAKWKELGKPGLLIKGTDDVNPLISTNWDQGQYYNEMCPVDAAGPDGHVWAGCVATTMGQVMKFHNHPSQGTGSHTYYNVDYGYISADFGSTNYNWLSMPNQIYSSNSEVATLLFHLGVSVDMQYGTDGSGAYTSDARDALVNYFSYSSDASFLCKINYSTTTWENMLKNELDASRPMVYQGANSETGHAWVCDGYQGSNYFHFNWGWSGYANGYFYLNNLNPGGSSFNDNQCALFNLYPDGSTILNPPLNLTASVINDNDVLLEWEPPEVTGNGEWIHWDDQTNSGNGIGLTNGGTFLVASRWTPADLTPFDGQTITKISFFANGDPAAIYQIKAWTGANAGTQIVSQFVTSFNVNQFNTVDLNTPIVIDASDELWFGYGVTHGAGTFPAGTDDGPAIAYSGDMIALDGTTWVSMSTDYGLDYNWNLAAYVESIETNTPAKPMVKTTTHYEFDQSLVASGSSGFPMAFKPSSSKALLGYNIYRNGSYIAYTTELTYLDENLIYETYDYYATAVYDEGESGPSNTVEVTGGIISLDPPTNLTAVVDNCQINLGWTPPGGAASEWIQWDSGTNTGNGIGLTDGGTFQVASRWSPSDLIPYNGMTISKLSFFPNGDAAATFTLMVWTGSNAGTLIMTQLITNYNVDEFNEVTLTNPIIIDASEELWFGYEVTAGAGTFPAGCDDGPAVQGFGDQISLDGSSWTGMSAAYGLDYNWNLAAFVESTDVNNPAKPMVKTKIHQITSGSFVAKGGGGLLNKFLPIESKAFLGYNIYRDGNFITFTQGAYYTEDLEPCTEYEFAVTAVYDEGESNPSNTALANIPCYPPENLIASVSGNINVLLTSDPPVCGSPSNYNFYRDGNLIGNNITPEFSDLGLSPGTYEYYSTAIWGVEESEPSNISSATIEENPPPEPCEDFDNLQVGGGVAAQLGGMWSYYWTPGGEGDGIVSDLYSVSPSNSMLVEGIADVNFQFDNENITLGKWMFSNSIYIPTGKTGYWNLQKDVVPGIEWGFQIMYEDDMTMVIDAGGAAAAVITYEYNTWYFNEIMVDLDNDWCQFFIDGTLIVEYQWTLGVFGTPGANTLGSVNFFANPGAGGTPPGAHFDDVCFLQGPINLNCQNFDYLNIGGYVAEQLGGNWTTWSETPGTPEDAFVTDVISNSPNNSFVVDAGTIDLILKLDEEPISTGQHQYSHYMYVPSGYSGYFNIQSEPTPGVDWVVELFFNDDGTGNVTENTNEHEFTYNQNEWIKVEIKFDLISDFAEVWLDGNLVLQWSNSYTIGGIDYFGWDVGGPPGAYYDDVCFDTGWGPPPPLDPPTNLVATISDCILELSWDPPGSKDLTGYNLYRKFNTGSYQLVEFFTGNSYQEEVMPCNTYYYIVTAVYDVGESEPSNEAVAEIPCYPPQNLEATVFDDVNVHLVCDPPVCGTPFTYNFYRDGNLIGGNELPEFDHMNLSPGNYEYHATVTWGEEESEPSNTQIVTIELMLYPPTNLTGPDWTWEYQAINLTWEAPQEVGTKDLLHYNVYRSYNYDPYELIGSPGTTAYEDWSEDLGVIEYYVTAFYEEGESDSTNHHLIDVIEGVAENLLESILFYPNPATDIVKINSHFIIESVKVYSFTGQMVINELVNKSEFTINISKLEPGLYLFQLETKKGRLTKRIVVQ